MRVGIKSIGVVSRGWPDWNTAREHLAQERGYNATVELPALAPTLLPANERRRTTSLTRLALFCAQNALQGYSASQRGMSTVFATSGGDLAVVDNILSALQLPGKPVSPTQFHNSVHNAPAGYWSIATGSHTSSISLSSYDGSFAAGLLDATSQILADERDVLLVAYDEPPPPALYRFRPIQGPFAIALLLGAPSSECTALGLELISGSNETQLDDPTLEQLRQNNPAARALPLLNLLSRGASGQVVLAYLQNLQLRLTVASQ